MLVRHPASSNHRWEESLLGTCGSPPCANLTALAFNPLAEPVDGEMPKVRKTGTSRPGKDRATA